MSSPTPDSNPYYPELLRRAEDELIKIRRDAAHFKHPPKERSGLAGLTANWINCQLVHHGPVEVFLASTWNPLGTAISPYSPYGLSQD